MIHDILAEVHRSEKIARTQSAIIQAQQTVIEEAESVHDDSLSASRVFKDSDPAPVETEAVILKDGKAYLKGNPLVTIKDIICPDCKLPRLLYPRVGYGARDPPDPKRQYCKNEPPIIIDKHDVHGQRKKGTKLKGQQGKVNKKKKTEAQSPPSSLPSEANTPQTNSFSAGEAFEFKVLEYPAVKCPHNIKGVQDHWKAANLMASHLNGNCWLKKDRQAGRDAAAKLSGTPLESRATTPKPSGGGKRGRADDSEGNGKKKQKLETVKKISKKALPGTVKMKEEGDQTTDDQESQRQSNEPGEFIKVNPKALKENSAAHGKTATDLCKETNTSGVKGTTAKKKTPKLNTKASVMK